MHNARVDVPDSIFLSRWWEMVMRVIFFMLGMAYSSYYEQTFENEYVALPLLLVAGAIILGRHAAVRRKKEIDDQKAIAEIVALELASKAPPPTNRKK